MHLVRRKHEHVIARRAAARAQHLAVAVNVQPPRIHCAFCVPEPHCQRPFTRKPPSQITALPDGANTPHINVSGSRKISRAASAGSRASTEPLVAPMNATQPHDASARASVSKTRDAFGRRYLEAAIRFRHEHPIEAGGCHLLREILRNAARVLDLGGARGN